MEGRRARAPRRMEVDAPAGSGNFPPHQSREARWSGRGGQQEGFPLTRLP